MQISVILLVWTCIFSLLSSIYALSEQTYPDDVTSVTANRLARVIVYVLTLLASAISLWEAYRNYFSGGGAGMIPQYGN